MSGVSNAELRAAYPGLAALAEAQEPEPGRTWLDGVALAAWLEGDLGLGMTRAHPSSQRLVRAARNGRIIRYDSLDRLLHREGLGCSLVQVPDRLWLDRSPHHDGGPRGPWKLLPEQRREAAQRYLDAPRGYGPGGTRMTSFRPRTAIAEEYGVTRQTLRGWAQLLQEGRLT